MSVCGQTEEDSASEETGVPVREIYEQKAVSKVVRVLTVLAYLLSVSLAAILLSVYYICVWRSPELPPLNETEGELSAHHGDHPDYYQDDNAPLHEVTGRSSTKVNDTVTPSVDISNSNSSHNISGFPSATYNLSDLTGETSITVTTDALLTEKLTLADSTLFDISNETSDDIGAYNFTSNSTNVT